MTHVSVNIRSLKEDMNPKSIYRYRTQNLTININTYHTNFRNPKKISNLIVRYNALQPPHSDYIHLRPQLWVIDQLRLAIIRQSQPL